MALHCKSAAGRRPARLPAGARPYYYPKALLPRSLQRAATSACSTAAAAVLLPTQQARSSVAPLRQIAGRLSP
eukprot:COSAG01_NODE_40874_length_458_cov_1.807799_1_plen_72_part_01